jgi:hypothetical protein
MSTLLLVVVHGLDVNNSKLEAGAWANAGFQTIIHGDPKAPNLFFKRGQSVAVVDEKAAGVASELEVGLVDMQWCGRGLGAVDLVYFIAASAGPTLIAQGADVAAVVQNLVDEYHTTLLASFVKFGVTTDVASASVALPAEIFQVQFEWAWIDLARVCVGDHWGAVTKEILLTRRSKMAFNAYNKSEPVQRMVAELTDVYLKRREQAADKQASL